VPDPFAILGLSPKFDIDLADAERRHRDLSKALHPDRYAGRPPAERRRALGKAIEVNEAWRTLRDPIRRSEALLEHLGLHVDEGEEPKPDPELLMEMMELREELADAGRSKNEQRLGELTTKVKARETKVTETLAREFANGRDPEKLLRALGELRYYRRFLDEAAAFEDDLF